MWTVKIWTVITWIVITKPNPNPNTNPNPNRRTVTLALTQLWLSRYRPDTKASMLSTACLDQLLIVIRPFTLLCDNSRWKTRLIAIMNLVAKLGIIYATAWHVSLCRTAWVSHVTDAAQHLLLLYKHGTGRGRWGLGSQLQQQLALWVCVKCSAGCH